jgi:hypothetical protein
VEVEGEHRLQVVPVDLHRAAPHPLCRRLLRWDSMGWIEPNRLRGLGFGEEGGKMEGIGRAAPLLLFRSLETAVSSGVEKRENGQ